MYYGQLIVATGDDLSTRIVRDEPGFLSKAFALTVGMGVGLVAGLVAGELIGGWDSDLVKGTLGRLGRRGDENGGNTPEPRLLERAVLEALRRDPETRTAGFNATVAPTGTVELTGVAPDEATRLLAGELARAVNGVPLVINRILVRGTDLPETTAGDAGGPGDNAS